MNIEKKEKKFQRIAKSGFEDIYTYCINFFSKNVEFADQRLNHALVAFAKMSKTKTKIYF